MGGGRRMYWMVSSHLIKIISRPGMREARNHSSNHLLPQAFGPKLSNSATNRSRCSSRRSTYILAVPRRAVILQPQLVHIHDPAVPFAREEGDGLVLRRLGRLYALALLLLSIPVRGDLDPRGRLRLGGPVGGRGRLCRVELGRDVFERCSDRHFC